MANCLGEILLRPIPGIRELEPELGINAKALPNVLPVNSANA